MTPGQKLTTVSLLASLLMMLWGVFTNEQEAPASDLSGVSLSETAKAGSGALPDEIENLERATRAMQDLLRATHQHGG